MGKDLKGRELGKGLHVLRHTFDTRCFEGGMKPKTIQKI